MTRGRKGGAADEAAPQPARHPPAEEALDEVTAAVKDAEAGERLLEIGRGDPIPGGNYVTADNQVIRPGEWEPDEYGLPPDCPVLPLGTDDLLFSRHDRADARAERQ